MLQKQNI